MKTPAEKKYNLLLTLIGFTLVLSVVLVTAGWFYVLNISKDAGKTLAEKENTESESNALSDLMIRYLKVQPLKPLLTQAIPENKDTSGFISMVEEIVKKNNLEISSSTIANQSKGKVNDLSQTIGKQGYNELHINYVVLGRYSDFTNFLKQMSEIRRVNMINDMNINYDLANSKDKPDAIRATFSVITYVKK